LSSFDFGQPFEIVKTNNTFSTYKNRQRAEAYQPLMERDFRHLRNVFREESKFILQGEETQDEGDPSPQHFLMRTKHSPPHNLLLPFLMN